MVAFQENIICGRFFIKFPTKFLKTIWGRSKSSFKKTSFEGDFCSKAVVAQEISPKISINNMREVKIKFQENINGLRFLHADRRSLWEYFSMSVITQ